MYDDTDLDCEQDGTEQLLQALLPRLLTAESLEQLCTDAELPVLTDEHDQPIHIDSARTYRQAQVMTLDAGVWLELSDGSAFGLTLAVSRRPAVEVRLRPPSQ